MDVAGQDFSGQDLRGRDFSGQRLYAANFAFADLSEANFSNASLVRATFLDANLEKCSFDGATLEQACLMGATASDASFRNADLTYAMLAGSFKRADFTDATLTHTCFLGSDLEDATLSATFAGTILCDLHLERANGLGTAVHDGHSFPDVRTVRRLSSGSAGDSDAIRRFLAGIGVEADDGPEAVTVTDHDAVATFDQHANHLIGSTSATSTQLAALSELLAQEPGEVPMQKFLEANPQVFGFAMLKKNTRWVIPNVRFGAEYVADFVLIHEDSLGFHYTLVELESPERDLFTMQGEQAQYLRHAIRQIRDWREWLQDNLGYARRDLADNGLGLRDIVPTAKGLVIIGRRSDRTSENRPRRRRIGNETGIDVHTYDWLVDQGTD